MGAEPPAGVDWKWLAVALGGVLISTGSVLWVLSADVARLNERQDVMREWIKEQHKTNQQLSVQQAELLRLLQTEIQRSMLIDEALRGRLRALERTLRQPDADFSGE